MRNRAAVVSELIDTEKQYLCDVNLLLTVYLDPLLDGCCSVAEETAVALRQLARDLKPLSALSQQLLQGLTSAVEKDSTATARIFPVFQLLSPYMLMYSQYLSSYGPSVGSVETHRKANGTFRAWLEDRR